MYKQTLKAKKEEHTEQLFQTMEESINTNNFWNTLYRPQREELAIQNENIWRTHFENLYKTIETNPAQNEIKTKLEILKEKLKTIRIPWISKSQ